MRKLHLFVLLIALAFVSHNVNAQKGNEPFDDIEPEILKMETYPSDSTAPAVILYKKGEFEPQNRFLFTVSMRIKILKKEGYEWAKFVKVAKGKQFIKGVTYNLQDGKIKEHSLNKKDIYEEDVVDGDYTRYRFALPKVKVGSVIDVSYTRFALPDEFRFQEKIPIKYAELILPQSQYVTYKKHFHGFQKIKPRSSFEWEASNMPSFRPEPFMNSESNYITRFAFEINQISIPGQYLRSYATDWAKVSGKLLGHSKFGETLSAPLWFLNKVVKEIETENETDKGKALAAYRHIKNTLTWNKQSQVFVDEGLNRAYKLQAGNSAEINLLLIKLLKKLDLKANPVVLSTREHGRLNPLFASYDKLNYVIAMVEIGEKTILLDATEKLLPAGELPKRVYNGKGRYIDFDEKMTGWIEIEPDYKKTSTTYTLDMKEDGSFSGTIKTTYENAAAYNFRKMMEKQGSEEEFLKTFKSEHPGIKINKCEIKNLDTVYKNVEVNMDVNISNQTNIVGNEMYFNPMFFEQIKKNPFQQETRMFPIDFAFPIENNYYLILNLPENYTIAKTPKSDIARLPENGGQYYYNITPMGQRVQIAFQQKQSKPLYTSNLYPYLKEFYRRMVEKTGEFVIAKTSTDE